MSSTEIIWEDDRKSAYIKGQNKSRKKIWGNRWYRIANRHNRYPEKNIRLYSKEYST